MKKINYKRILLVLSWAICLSGLAISLAFVNKEQRAAKVNALNISITNDAENQFIDEEGVKTYFDERNDKILNQAFHKLDLHQLEKALNAHPAIENAEVNYNMNGELAVKVTQRCPVVRVITTSGESYYIDRLSKLMPLSDNYTARVLIASGAINETYAARYTLAINDIRNNKTFKEISVLDDVLEIATKINADTLLSQLIHQVYVSTEKELELFPAIGNHRIVIGSVENLDEKLNKLKVFYKQGLNKTNSWTKYSVINLKYRNLVVCTAAKASNSKK